MNLRVSLVWFNLGAGLTMMAIAFRGPLGAMLLSMDVTIMFIVLIHLVAMFHQHLNKSE